VIGQTRRQARTFYYGNRAPSGVADHDPRGAIGKVVGI